MAQNGSKRHAAQPDLEDLQSGPRPHTSSKNVRDATGTKPAQTEAAEQSLNKFSRTITQSKSQGGSQARLYATGMTEGDMDKPQVRLTAVVRASLGHALAVCADFNIEPGQGVMHAGGHFLRVVGGQPLQHASA